MAFLTFLTLFMGVMYLWMGFLICFRESYRLINNYDADVKAGKFDQAYAKRVGAIMLVCGIACAAAGAAALCGAKGWLTAALLCLCVFGSMAALRLHYQRSRRDRA